MHKLKLISSNKYIISYLFICYIPPNCFTMTDILYPSFYNSHIIVHIIYFIFYPCLLYPYFQTLELFLSSLNQFISSSYKLIIFPSFNKVKSGMCEKWCSNKFLATSPCVTNISLNDFCKVLVNL